MAHYEKPLSSQRVFTGRVISLDNDRVLLENGAEAGREVVRHRGGVCIAAVDENENILMVSQYRYPVAKELLELPAGKLEAGEHHYDTGIRELREETGARAERYEPMGSVIPSPGYCDEVIYLYRAEGLTFAETDPDEDEFLTLRKIPLAEAVEMVLRNEITDSKSVAGILKVALLRAREKEASK